MNHTLNVYRRSKRRQLKNLWKYASSIFQAWKIFNFLPRKSVRDLKYCSAWGPRKTFHIESDGCSGYIMSLPTVKNCTRLSLCVMPRPKKNILTWLNTKRTYKWLLFVSLDPIRRPYYDYGVPFCAAVAACLVITTVQCHSGRYVRGVQLTLLGCTYIVRRILLSFKTKQ